MKILRQILFLLVVFVTLPALQAQFIFYKIPADRKMIPRDKDNIGRFELSGKSLDPVKKYVRVLIHNEENDTYHFDKTIKLDEQSKFAITIGIPAGFAEYKLIIYSYDLQANQTLEREVPGLVAGDYFIVGGQSNAVGSNGYTEEGFLYDSIYSNKYCRSLGTLFERAEYINWYLTLDCAYYTPSSIYYQDGCVASWPYRLMYELCKRTGVPLCFINCGRGGTPIAYHMASSTPSDSSKLQVINDTASGRVMKPYDRTYLKLLTHDVLKGVRGIFWYQGESDGNSTLDEALAYTQGFGKLRESWKADYPNLEKIFVFQINTGCWGAYEDRVRDQQRKWPELFDDVVVVPSVGSNQDDKDTDGCHYNLKGRSRLAEILYPIVLKNLYGFQYPDNEIMGPAIQRISYESPWQLCLEFDMDIDLQLSAELSFPHKGTLYLKDYFYKKSYERLPISDMRALGNKLYLTLSNPFEKTDRLTYLPNFFSDYGVSYMGPWILNKNNSRIGALAFFEFPVSGGYINVFPSPADQYIEVQLFHMIIKEIRMYDLTGKLIFKAEPDPEETNLRIPVSHLERGIYSLSFVMPDESFVKKVLIQHE